MTFYGRRRRSGCPDVRQRGFITLTGTPDASTGELEWILNDYDAARTQAAHEQKPVFIDFTGYTCHELPLDGSQYVAQARSEVGVRRVRNGSSVYRWSQSDLREATEHATTKVRYVALPLYAIVRPDGSAVATFAGLTRNATEFIAFQQREIVLDRLRPMK